MNAKYVHPKIIQGIAPESTIIAEQPNLRRVTVRNKLEGNFTIRYTPRNVEDAVLGNSTDQ